MKLSSKRAGFGIVVVLLAVLLLGWRWVGESEFKILPQQIPQARIDKTTALHKKIQRWLDKNEDGAPYLFYELGDANQALLARIMLAQKSESTLDAQYYLFHDDDVGRAYLEALTRAAKRGVKVRLLLDDMDTKGREGFFIRLVQEYENLEIRIFNPFYSRYFRTLEFLVRFPRVNRRMHNKSMTIDNIVTIVGGRNIGNAYFNLNTEVAFSDLDVLSAGGIANEVTEVFDAYWYSGIAFDIERLGSPTDDAAYDIYRDEMGESLDKLTNAMNKEDLPIRKLLLEKAKPFAGKGYVISDKPDKVVTKLRDLGDSMAPKINALLGTAKSSLLITSPYFIPGKPGMKTFKELSEKNVNITILTNSLAANDVAAVHSAYMETRKPLLELGVHLYEMKPDNEIVSKFSLLGSKRSSLHAKSFIVDKTTSFIGSFNIDPRSAIHNTEMGIVFENKTYATGAYEKMTESMSMAAYHVVLNAKGDIEWHETMPDKSMKIHTEEPYVSWSKRAFIQFISYLPIGWLL